jgi:hypothetical protein
MLTNRVVPLLKSSITNGRLKTLPQLGQEMTNPTSSLALGSSLI